MLLIFYIFFLYFIKVLGVLCQMAVTFIEYYQILLANNNCDNQIIIYIMRIHGIGVDLVKNSRIQKILVKSYAKNFITKVLHKEEIKQFDKLLKNEAQVQYVASRWAVKQAVIKAVGRRQLIFSQLQTVKDGYGKPYLNVCSQYNKKLLQQMHVQKIHISLAHEDDFTTAYAIAISK